ncbi:TIGR02452 family protein [Paenibacillus sp. CAU 1782]
MMSKKGNDLKFAGGIRETGARVNRKQVAEQTLAIIERGCYERDGCLIDISSMQKQSVKGSRLLAPKEALALLERVKQRLNGPASIREYVGDEATKASIREYVGDEATKASIREYVGDEATKASIRQYVRDEATIAAILSCPPEERSHLGVLNFASAKNPGGGFLGGAMAQEESLAASSGLYATLLPHERYYVFNRKCGTMMYSHHSIFSPDVVFFRDAHFHLLAEPATASVLTLPAVNFGQVVLKGENIEEADRVMKERMELALAIFAEAGMKRLVLGAYGCGVFRNDPAKIAAWWNELLTERGYGYLFDEVVYAVLDRSRDQACMKAFQKEFSR